MRKLQLDLAALRVDSFQTLPREGRARGTVHGRETALDPSCGTCDPTCDTATECGFSGRMTCQNTCSTNDERACLYPPTRLPPCTGLVLAP